MMLRNPLPARTCGPPCTRCSRPRPGCESTATPGTTSAGDRTFENPKTGAVLETVFVYQDSTKGTDPYLSVTSRATVPPNPYRR